jgi:hypothetical protein
VIDEVKRGRPPADIDRKREIVNVGITMTREMRGLLQEYSQETGKPITFIGRNLFSQFLRSDEVQQVLQRRHTPTFDQAK